jgi:hypothetical protein
MITFGTKLKTLAVTGFLAASVAISSLAATPPPAAEAAPVSCSQILRMANVAYRDAQGAFARGDFASGMASLARADALIDSYISSC